MTSVPMHHILMFASVLFALGLLGVLKRRNLIFIFMSVEIMLNAAALVFVAAACKFGAPDGQIMFVFILSVAAAEVAIGLGLVLRYEHMFKTLDANAANQLKG